MAVMLFVVEVVFVGIVATLVCDLWQVLLKAAAGGPSSPWGLVGRWVAGFPRGVFVHRQIMAAPAVAGELALGWSFHYAVGIVYAALYLALTEWGLEAPPTLASAVIFALVMLVAPWFIMMPALGLGIMASRAPKPTVTRALNVATHIAFGLGLYLGAVVWEAVAG